MTFFITGTDPQYDYYFDDVKITLYERDRSWTPLADMRINEFRRMDVDFDVLTPNADHIEVKMTKNNFRIGGIVDNKMEDDMENWPDFFVKG